jgi:hypothetical protein
MRNGLGLLIRRRYTAELDNNNERLRGGTGRKEGRITQREYSHTGRAGLFLRRVPSVGDEEKKIRIGFG